MSALSGRGTTHSAGGSAAPVSLRRLCAGFITSAVLVFAVAGLAGLALGVRLVPPEVRLWAALAWCTGLVVLDVAPWWQGAVYGPAFCLPIAAAVRLVPAARDRGRRGREPHWISEVLTGSRPVAQSGALSVALVVCGALLRSVST